MIVAQFASLQGAHALPYIVCNHLSSHEPFEFPGPFIEAEVADEIWCNSPETKRGLARFGVRFEEAMVVPNPAPAGFKGEPTEQKTLNKILSISNHLPEEVGQALDILQSRGVEVERIGSPNHARRVVPGDIRGADALISIGKSVQYALLARRPVYCYDWFGGPGWLTSETFHEAADGNFSGRCSRTVRSAEQIADEIQTGFRDAWHFSAGLKDGDLQAYAWPRYIGPLLDRLSEGRAAATGRLRRAIDAVAGLEAPNRWRHEVDLYGLIDREFGKARELSKRGEALAQQVARLRSSKIGVPTS
jgi:hypothetical protein